MFHQARAAKRAAAISFLAVSAFLASGVTGSNAAASPSPIMDPSYADQLWGEVSGATWPDTFPASWAAPAVEDAGVAAGAMPALSAIGTFALGAGAFSLGWKIGRTIDTKWLHLTGDIGVRLPQATQTVSWQWRASFACNSNWTPDSCQGPGWYARTSSYDYYCNAYQYPYNYQTGCPFPTWVYDEMQSLPGTAVPITNVSSPYQHCGGGGSGGYGPCWVRKLTSTQMESLLIHSAPQPYTGQSYGATTNIAAPVKNDSTVGAIRDSLNGAGAAVQNEVNSSLDPFNWARPGPNGSPAGGLITDWTMPDCSGYELTDCESMVDAAATAANNPIPGFITTIDAGNPIFMPGAVLDQSVGAGSAGRPPSVSVTANPDPLNGFSGADGYGGGGDSTTTADGPQCDFPDWAPPPSWETVTSTLNPDRGIYLDACDEAWQAAYDAGLVDELGLPTSWTNNDDVIIPGRYLQNQAVIDALTSDGSDITDWAKIRSPTFETPDGPAELHAYKNLSTGSINTSIDWKLVFEVPF